VLVLSRKINESVIIGDNIQIMVVEIKGDQIKLGISAPKEVTVYRGEIFEAIQNENKEASQSTIPGGVGNLLKKNNKLPS